MTWDGWNWFYESMADAKKLPVDPLLNPFSSMPNLADRATRMKRRPIAIMWRSCSDSLLIASQMD
jgi:hypothetical protein